MSDDPGPARRIAREFRRWRRGTLVADARPTGLRFVADPSDGSLIAPLERWALDAEEHVLWLPEERESALQLLIAPVAARVTECLADRWATHHGAPPGCAGSAFAADPDPKGDERAPIVWVRFDIECARFEGAIADGEEITGPNPLSLAEAKACRTLNGDRDALWRACRSAIGADVPDPVCVSVDPAGVHVRGKLGVLRIEFEREAADEGDLTRAIEALLRRAEGR